MKKEIKSKTGRRITVDRKIHRGWEEWGSVPKELKTLHPNGVFGKYHFIFKSKKGEISLIELKDYFYRGRDVWEIYSRETLFRDVMRFDSKEEAIEKIKEIL